MPAATIYREILADTGMKPFQLEKLLGMNSGGVRNAITRDSEIKASTAKRIAEVLPQYDVQWLLTGEGDKYAAPNLSGKSSISNVQGVGKEVDINTTEGTIKGSIIKNPLTRAGDQSAGAVPYYDVDFAAGNGIAFYEDNVDRPAYIMQIPGFAGCIAFTSYGDSMEKVIRRGSILFGRKLEEWRSYLEYGQIYGIVMDDGRRFLKYIRKASDPKKSFLLHSENEKYDPFEIPQNKIHNIWLIEGWMLKTA